MKAYQNGRIVSRAGVLLLENALKHGISAKNMHIIGYSLGAHVGSFVAKAFNQETGLKIGRLTGLDPAGPFAENCGKEARIDKTDADYVDLIISNPGQMPNLGLELPVGHSNVFISDSVEFPCGLGLQT